MELRENRLIQLCVNVCARIVCGPAERLCVIMGRRFTAGNFSPAVIVLKGKKMEENWLHKSFKGDDFPGRTSWRDISVSIRLCTLACSSLSSVSKFCPVEKSVWMKLSKGFVSSSITGSLLVSSWY